MCIFELFRLHVSQEQKIKRHAYNIRYMANIKSDNNKQCLMQKKCFLDTEKIVIFPDVQCANELFGKSCIVVHQSGRYDAER